MSYGNNRNQKRFKSSYKSKIEPDRYVLAPASGHYIEQTADNNIAQKAIAIKTPKFGKKAQRIAELYERFGNNGIIDMYIRAEFGAPCTELDWKNAFAYLKQKENAVKKTEYSIEKRKENQQNYLSEIIDCAVKNKDYDLNKLANQLKTIPCLDEVNEENLDEASRAYLVILRKYQKIPFADKELDVMQRVVAALKLPRNVVRNSLKYLINSSQEEWDSFIKERNSLNPTKKLEDLTKN